MQPELGKEYGDRILKALTAIIERIKDCRDDDNSLVGKCAEYHRIDKDTALGWVMQDDMSEFIGEELLGEISELVDALWAVQTHREIIGGLIDAPEEFNTELKQSFMKGI